MLHVLEKPSMMTAGCQSEAPNVALDMHQGNPNCSKTFRLPNEEMILMRRSEMPLIVGKCEADVDISVHEHRLREDLFNKPPCRFQFEQLLIPIERIQRVIVDLIQPRAGPNGFCLILLGDALLLQHANKLLLGSENSALIQDVPEKQITFLLVEHGQFVEVIQEMI